MDGRMGRRVDKAAAKKSVGFTLNFVLEEGRVDSVRVLTAMLPCASAASPTAGATAGPGSFT